MRTTVVGGGIFGCTIAVELARAGLAVDLFERRHDILLGASRGNQGRLHAGYHYPRSMATVRELRDQILLFGARFPGAVRPAAAHYYLVASGGLTSGRDFLAFCDQSHLVYSVVEGRHRLIQRAELDVAVRISFEAFVDVGALRVILRRELADAGVRVKWNVKVDPAGLAGGYDWVIDATYGASGTRRLRFEVCEVALVKLGRQFAGQSFVVMDGPFCSLDPVPGSDLHALYDVVHSVHHVAEGFWPEVPIPYVPLVDQGPKFTSLTRVAAMEQTLRRFVRGVGMPQYCGSLFSVRAVLPDVDDTDARPTLVERDGNLVSVLSGKIVTAVSAAQRVVQLVQPAEVAA